MEILRSIERLTGYYYAGDMSDDDFNKLNESLMGDLNDLDSEIKSLK